MAYRTHGKKGHAAHPWEVSIIHYQSLSRATSMRYSKGWRERLRVHVHHSTLSLQTNISQLSSNSTLQLQAESPSLLYIATLLLLYTVLDCTAKVLSISLFPIRLWLEGGNDISVIDLFLVSSMELDIWQVPSEWGMELNEFCEFTLETQI